MLRRTEVIGVKLRDFLACFEGFFNMPSGEKPSLFQNWVANFKQLNLKIDLEVFIVKLYVY